MCDRRKMITYLKSAYQNYLEMMYISKLLRKEKFPLARWACPLTENEVQQKKNDNIFEISVLKLFRNDVHIKTITQKKNFLYRGGRVRGPIFRIFMNHTIYVPMIKYTKFYCDPTTFTSLCQKYRYFDHCAVQAVNNHRLIFSTMHK